MANEDFKSGYDAAVLRFKIMAGFYGLDEDQTSSLEDELAAYFISLGKED